MYRLLTLLAPALLTTVIGIECSVASLVGTDNSSQGIYSPSWDSSDNGAASGDAFNAWSLNSVGTAAGFFIGDSTNVAGGSGANINTSGSSFGMFGDSNSAKAYRKLNGSLGIGQSFTIDIAANFRNGNKGIDVFNPSSTKIFNFNIGGDDYVADGNSIGNTYSSDTAFALTLTQATASAGTWSINRSGGVTDSDSGTYSGLIDAFELYVVETDGGPNNDLYFNNLAVIPEPTSLLLVGLAAVIGACVTKFS